MRPRPRPRPSRSRPRLLAALAMLMAVLAAPAAGASPARSGHGHRCKCGQDCGGSCCCRPKPAGRPAGRPKSAIPTPAPVPPVDGPCFAAAPCGGGEGLPGTPASSRITKAAALDTAVPLALTPAGDRPAIPPCPRPPKLFSTPPDEPPEIPARVA